MTALLLVAAVACGVAGAWASLNGEFQASSAAYASATLVWITLYLIERVRAR